MAFCSKCGATLKESVKFCPECGAPIWNAPERTMQAAPQQTTLYRKSGSRRKGKAFYGDGGSGC